MSDLTFSSDSFSSLHLFSNSFALALLSSISVPMAAVRSRDGTSSSLRSDSRSISNVAIERSSDSSASGLDSCCSRSVAAASSTRSMALSGRKRSVMYCRRDPI